MCHVVKIVCPKCGEREEAPSDSLFDVYYTVTRFKREHACASPKGKDLILTK